MAEVNEEIIEQYLKLVKKWFYVTDISFRVPGNYSNIDLLAFDPQHSQYYDIEVKYRSAYTLTAKNRSGEDVSKKSVMELVDQFTSYPTREVTIRNYTNKQTAKKILVTTKNFLGRSQSKRNQMERAFYSELSARGHDNATIWYFDDIIPELVDQLDPCGRYNTQLLQAIRMIKEFVISRPGL
jgi:hypothetical protein